MFKKYPDVLSVPEVRQMIGISRELAYTLVREGEFESIKVAGAYKITKKSIEEFVMKNEELFKVVPIGHSMKKRKTVSDQTEELKLKCVK